MIKIAFLKQLKGMPIDIAKILIAHKGYKIAPFIERVLSLHPVRLFIIKSFNKRWKNN